MKYIIYSRKSTDSEDRQVMSLDSQERELLDIAEKNNLKVVKIFRESMSAKSAGRPIFNEVMKMIQSGKADSILCWKLDRLARNFIDGGLIIDSLQKTVIKEIRTYESIHLPSETVFLLAMQFGMANQYSRDLSVNVKRGNREKLAQGGWPNFAPYGYLNQNKNIFIDPLTSKYIIRAFELYIKGSYGFKDLSKKLYDEGVRSRLGKKLHSGHLQRIINNPFYTGVMVREGKYYQGKHEPLISKQMFDMAVKVSNDRSRPRPKTLFFPLRGFLKCENCGCVLTASIKKGYHYYYCTNGKGKCEEHKRYSREVYLYNLLAEILGTIDFSERKIEIMYQSAKEKLGLNTDYKKNVQDNLNKQLESLKTKESRLLDAFLAEQITKELYDKKVLEIQNEKVSLSMQIKEQGSSQPLSTLERTKEVFLLASRAKKEFLNGNDYKKREILESLLWNVSFKEKKVAKVSLKSPFDIMSKGLKSCDILTMRCLLYKIRTYFESNPDEE